MVVVMLVGAAVMFGARWYMYVGLAETPYDEVGITLNGYAPAPLRHWGCNKLQARFPAQLPPYGCAGPDGRSWM